VFALVLVCKYIIVFFLKGAGLSESLLLIVHMIFMALGIALAGLMIWVSSPNTEHMIWKFLARAFVVLNAAYFTYSAIYLTLR